MNRCPDPACAAAFDLVLAREFEDPAYFAVHQLTVAAYQLDHPEGASDLAITRLLSVLRAAVVDGMDGPALLRHNRRESHRLRVHPPGPIARPRERAATGILDVAAASDADAHCTVVRGWAAQVWAVWER